MKDSGSEQFKKVPAYLNMEFYSGFLWAVPEAFADAIAHCRFDEGDILYDTRKAYAQWDNALKVLNYSIQIKHLSKTRIKDDEGKAVSVFKQNWNSPVEIEVTYYKSGQQRNRFSTTQGRLFTFLRYGDFKVFDTKTREPEIPLSLNAARKLLDKIIISSFRKLLNGKMEKPNIFIMVYDPTNDIATFKFQEIYCRLKTQFKTSILEQTLQKCNVSNWDKFLPTISFKCIAIDSGKSEEIRDVIKEVLWPKTDNQTATKNVNEIITKKQNKPANPFKLSNHGLFSPYITKKYDSIRTHSFHRGNTFFRYRVSVKNICKLPKSLRNYLELVFTDCPNHLFAESSFRASNVKVPNNVKLTHDMNSELIEFAKQSRSFTSYKSRHENLEKYMLEKDPYTVASEIPVWIESREFKDYLDIFKTKDALTGHIDILRYEKDEKVGVWDYKPKAYDEKFAAMQVFLYAFMLSVRTGIALKNFVCGYFDEVDALYFNPSEFKHFKL